MLNNHHFQKNVTQRTRALRRRIGHNLYAARAARRMPLDRLAKLCGLRADRIDRLEMGRGEIALDQVVRLALALRVDAAALFADAPEPPDNPAAG